MSWSNHRKVAQQKLTPEQVKEIRSLAEGGETHFNLAVRFGVTPVTIGRIVRRQTWKDV